MKPYEEIDFPNGFLRWIREDGEYVCRLTEEQMEKIKALHEAKPENEDYPLEFTGHYLIGMNPKTEEDGGYWDTPQEARLEFSLQFAELSGDAEGKFLFVRKAPMLEMHRPFEESKHKYRMIGRFSIAKLKEKTNDKK